MSSFSCISCRETFRSLDEQRLHNKTNFHLFNLKRKIAQLHPITREAYDNLLSDNLANQQTISKTFSCSSCNKHYSTAPALSQHTNSKKHIEKSKLKQDKQRESKEINTSSSPSLNSNLCLFCKTVSSDVNSNLEHMKKDHGFILPDRRFLNNRLSLLYLLLKIVYIDHNCLYCNKTFRSTDSAQTHMISKNHCRVLYRDENQTYDISDLSIEEESLLQNCSLAKNGLELVLNDGRVVGHRSLAIYYRQRFISHEEEEEEVTPVQHTKHSSKKMHNPITRHTTSSQTRLMVKANKLQRHTRANVRSSAV